MQASTSIISISRSSDNVLRALSEVRSVTSSIRPIEGAQISTDGQGGQSLDSSMCSCLIVGFSDEHLQRLQSLAAHLKLLLDAPEHLWRFMERKLYLHAAWLLLLSRVVHRSLLRDDEEDAAWLGLGIDISVRMADSPFKPILIFLQEQFPIVQRQWDAVSQFRPQILHKATIALRESSITTPVCNS